MKYSEFLEQDEYCRENNTPEGRGCDNCPATDREHCADALRNLCGKYLTSIGKPEFHKISKQLKQDYGLSAWNQLALIQGWLELPQ